MSKQPRQYAPPAVPWSEADRLFLNHLRTITRTTLLDVRHWARELYQAETREERDRHQERQLATLDAVYGTEGRSEAEATAWAKERLEAIRKGRGHE